MGIVAVDASVGQESVKMQLAVIFPDIVHRLQQNFILKEVAVLDRLGDPCQILIDDTAGSHVKVSDLRVSHLPVRETDIQPAGLSLHKRILLHQAVHHRFVCLSDRVMVFSRIQSISVKDHQYSWSLAHTHLSFQNR